MDGLEKLFQDGINGAFQVVWIIFAMLLAVIAIEIILNWRVRHK